MGVLGGGQIGGSGPGGGPATVQSVNAQTGVVVLDAADVGADPAGTASAAVSTHVGLADPHGQYTLESGGSLAGGSLSGTTTVTGTLSASGATAATVPNTALGSGSEAVNRTHVATNYAPLASPTLTGDPKAPTPAAGDSDTSIATTAFTQQEIAAYHNAAKNIRQRDDFLTGSTSGQLGWVASRNGSGAFVAANNAAVIGAEGFIALNAGSNSNTGRAAISFARVAGQLPFVRPWLRGAISFAWRCQLPFLPVAATSEYRPSLSLGDRAGVAGTSFVNGVGLVLDVATSPNWILKSRNGAADIASVDTGIAALAATWQWFTIVIDGVSARAYIGATKATAALVATIPIASVTTGANLGPQMKTRTVSGTTAGARSFLIDTYEFDYVLTTAR